MADITPNLTDNTEELNAILEILQNKAAGSGSSGTNIETSIVTINTPTGCCYLSTDFQFKEEITSTFETIKNSIVCISGRIVGGSGYATIVIEGTTNVILVQSTETTVNITVGNSGGAD